ncbi:MAG: SUMF1/EgtB/PvdO family nonheme iron enzyme [Bryobacterales bacterium]|nr:SUMF1/EgtB/PvdO family nonheme iron enzyme [Bryobacterales bacterium]
MRERDLKPFKNFRWIVADPEWMGGRPSVRGTRFTVSFLLSCLAKGMTVEQIEMAYGEFPHEAIAEIMNAAAELLDSPHLSNGTKALTNGFHSPDAVRISPTSGQRYCWIPAGKFEMGAPDDDLEAWSIERPRHLVTISKGFWMAETPTTVAAYREYCRSTGRVDPADYQAPEIQNYPMPGMNWMEARDYCEWDGGRLPSEAEWEYAARAGANAPRYGELDRIAWHRRNSGGRTHPVKTKQSNALGLYDMLGNVCEWTAGWYGPYSAGPATNPTGPFSGTGKVVRGGSYLYGGRLLRSTYRGCVDPEHRDTDLGFRCLRPSLP